VGAIAGVILVLLGTEMFYQLLFPIAFLAFMVPLPEVLIEKVSFNLKLLAAGAASGVMEALGLAVVREGSYIGVPDGTVVVDNVCSGLKYLIALTAFGALYAYISPLKRQLKPVLFALSIPISFAANVFRVTLMVLVAYIWGVAASEKWYSHDLFGIALFVVALALLWAAESALLGRMRGIRSAGGTVPRPTETPYGAASDSPAGEAVRKSAGAAPRAALCVLALAAVLSTYLAWPRSTPSATNVLASFPLALGDWRGQDFKLDDRVYNILGTRDVLSRSYGNDLGKSLQLVIVLSQQSGKRTHPPDQCFAGEGNTTVSSEDRTVSCSEAAPIRVHELVLDRWDGCRVVWYFYKSGPNLNTSYWRHQAGVALRKLRNPAAADLLIRVDTFVRHGDVEHGRALLLDFLSHSLPPILTSLP
jgi:EpsI family protein